MADTGPAAPVLWKTFLASSAVLLLGLVLFWHATAGGNAFTTETLRRTEVEQSSRTLPDLPVLDARGRRQPLTDLLTDGSRIFVVDFIYTRCQTVCLAMGTAFQQLQQQIRERGLQGRVSLVSISFDPLHDNPAALRDYAQRMRIDPAVWQLATLATPADRRALLDAFGIIVIPAPLGEFEHNAALHIVSGGKLVRIFDLDEALHLMDQLVPAGP